jgi:hypothetical protein
MPGYGYDSCAIMFFTGVKLDLAHLNVDQECGDNTVLRKNPRLTVNRRLEETA